MSRLHDMGGRLGDGPVRPDPEDAPAFAEEWHARALALTLASGALGQWTLDRSRFARESLPPATYTAYSYYEIWLAGLADLLVAQGVVTRAALSGAVTGAVAPPPLRPDLVDRRLPPEKVPATLARGAPVTRLGPAPRFAPGDVVLTRHPARNTLMDKGHTRLPRYVAGLEGRVTHVHGCHILPDAHAHGLGEQPEPLYTVVFAAEAIWGVAEHPDDTVSCDLWESYLEAVE